MHSVSIPIKDKNWRTLQSREEIEARWVEHFQEMLNQPIPCTMFDFTNTIPPKKLDVDVGPISTTEVRIAIRSLKNNKAPGLDEIAAELLKHGGDGLVRELTNLLNSCWWRKCVPEDWRTGVIIKIPKKGNLSNCNNW